METSVSAKWLEFCQLMATNKYARRWPGILFGYFPLTGDTQEYFHFLIRLQASTCHEAVHHGGTRKMASQGHPKKGDCRVTTWGLFPVTFVPETV